VSAVLYPFRISHSQLHFNKISHLVSYLWYGQQESCFMAAVCITSVLFFRYKIWTWRWKDWRKNETFTLANCETLKYSVRNMRMTIFLWWRRFLTSCMLPRSVESENFLFFFNWKHGMSDDSYCNWSYHRVVRPLVLSHLCILLWFHVPGISVMVCFHHISSTRCSPNFSYYCIFG